MKALSYRTALPGFIESCHTAGFYAAGLATLECDTGSGPERAQ